jgi:phosphotransferase system IIB component
VPRQRSIENVKRDYSRSLMRLPGVVGVGIDHSLSDVKRIKVMIEQPSKVLDQTLPKQLEGYAVVVEVIGKIHAR